MEQQRRRVNHRGRIKTIPPYEGSNLGQKHPESRSWAAEVVLRAALFCLFFMTENMRPFQRVILPEEMWLYRYPIPEQSYLEQIGGPYLQWLLDPLPTIFYIVVVIVVKLIVGTYPIEARQAAYAFFLALPFTGSVVNIMKNIAGRPRPDFLARCYGTYYYLQYHDMSRACYHDDMYAQDGRKSFPSGHSALAACCFGFLAIYFAGQVGAFQERAKYRMTTVIITIPILLLPIVVAISRTCDYKHHWQDVCVGLIIGFAITYMSYRVYFPSLMDRNSHMPYVCIPVPVELVLDPHENYLQDYSSDEEEDAENLSDDNNDNSTSTRVCRNRAIADHRVS